ncbi:5676_t:CDS:2 [Entrophospora sp. SA101]|nr:5676_t:CDS:2 [Entrophospora sp. SA101]
MKPGEFQQKNFTAWQTEYNQAATTQRLNWKKEEGQALIIENNAPSPKTSLRFKIYHRRQRAIAKWVGQFIKSENILHRHHQITITTNNAVLISNAIPAANTITIIVIISNTIITITAIAASQKIVAFDESGIPKVSENPPVYQLGEMRHAEKCFYILKRYRYWNPGYVGFDTETTVFRQKDRRLVSMIQLATRDFCFLFQVYRITGGHSDYFPRQLKNFLCDGRILKVGVNATGDSNWLRDSYDFECNGLVDLEKMAHRKGYSANSLSELTRMFADPGLVLEKSKKKLFNYNFDHQYLTSELIIYASADAFAGFQIYENLLKDNLNEEYLNYEKFNPKSTEEEDVECYELLNKELIRGDEYRKHVIIQILEKRYDRWAKTKPKTDDRYLAALDAFDRFIENKLIIKVDENGDEDDRDSETDDSEESNFYDEDYSNNNNNSGNKKRNEKKTKKNKVTVNRNIKYKLPGTSISDLFSSSYFFEYCNGKGLTQEESDLLKKVWKFVLLKDIHKDSLARVYMNNRTIDSMTRKGVFVYGEKYGFVIINQIWLKDFEKSYENFIESEKALSESCIIVDENNQQEKDSA